MKAKKLKDLPAELHNRPYPHSLRQKRPQTWANKAPLALVIVQPASGEGPRREHRFHATTLHVASKGITYYGVAHGTFEVVSLGEDAEHAWEHWGIWCAAHLEKLVHDLATGKKPRLKTVFCTPRPKQLNLL